MRSRLVWISFLALTACSGKIVAPDSTDASTSVDGGTTGDAGGLDAGPSCADLATQLAALRSQARTCCPICKSIQCQTAVDDVCCPISVTGQASAEFVRAVADYKAQCHPLCPATPCPIAPSGICQSGDPSNPGAHGLCQ